tara:strand:- start:447 stop:938 length:492 start_codon:yes stop_codon:yes gene_type:complete
MARGGFGRIGTALAAAGLVAAAASPLAAQQLDKWWKIKYYEGSTTFDYYPITLRIDSGRAKHKAGNTLHPAYVVQLENASKEAQCAAFYFKALRQSYSNDMFESGNGAVYYIKGGKTQKVAAWLYTRSPKTQDFGFEKMTVHSWDPLGKNRCGPDPSGRPDMS